MKKIRKILLYDIQLRTNSTSPIQEQVKYRAGRVRAELTRNFRIDERWSRSAPYSVDLHAEKP